MTLSGNLDFAAGSVKLDGQSSENTISTRDLASTTSVIRMTAVEDLGGGMKATASFGLDPRVLANDAGALGRDELFVGVSGGFGNIRLGSPNSVGLTTYGVGAPLGTGVGSGYAALALDYSAIRYNRSARYDSPNFNGFAFAINYAPGADAAVASTTAGVAGTIIPAAATEATEVGVTYANGPLNIAYANVAQSRFGTNGKTSTNILSANYKIGAATLYAGWNDGDVYGPRAATVAKTEGYRLGAAYAMGAVNLLASYAEQKSASIKEKVTGLRADYNLSKTSALYAAYELYDNGNATNSDRTITAIGIRKSF